MSAVPEEAALALIEAARRSVGRRPKKGTSGTGELLRYRRSVEPARSHILSSAVTLDHYRCLKIALGT